MCLSITNQSLWEWSKDANISVELIPLIVRGGDGCRLNKIDEEEEGSAIIR